MQRCPFRNTTCPQGCYGQLNDVGAYCWAEGPGSSAKKRMTQPQKAVLFVTVLLAVVNPVFATGVLMVINEIILVSLLMVIAWSWP